MAVTQFVRQYSDLSSESGFQFEFFCDRCQTGYQTDFVDAKSNMLPDVVNTVGSLLGGVFNVANDMAERARSSGWEKEHDVAFDKAIEQIKPYFHQCRACRYWVDTACWNTSANQCVECVTTHVEADTNADDQMVTCPACEAEVNAGKFCADCGKPLQKACPSCGAISVGRFCPDCGKKLLK